jgi:streptogramin lyase
VTDPPNYRVLEFTDTGEFVGGWGGYSTLSDGFANPSAVVVDAQGHAWVSDSANNLILRFTLP